MKSTSKPGMVFKLTLSFSAILLLSGCVAFTGTDLSKTFDIPVTVDISRIDVSHARENAAVQIKTLNPSQVYELVEHNTGSSYVSGNFTHRLKIGEGLSAAGPLIWNKYFNASSESQPNQPRLEISCSEFSGSSTHDLSGIGAFGSSSHYFGQWSIKLSAKLIGADGTLIEEATGTAERRIDRSGNIQNFQNDLTTFKDFNGGITDAYKDLVGKLFASSKVTAALKQVAQNESAVAAIGSTPAPTRPAFNPANRSYRALIIGINDYANYPKLQNAVSDAQSVGDCLKAHYNFDVTSLVDRKATRREILATIRQLIIGLKEGDNFFIYYAGHGWMDEVLKEGYWIPADASSQADYISNAEIHKIINAMEKAQHVVLVADSCFAGSFMTRAADRAIGVRPAESLGDKTKQKLFFEKMDARKSRLVLTSGANEPVDDGGREGHSIFGYYFLRALNSPDEPVFTSAELMQRVQKAVGNNSSQTPLTGFLNAAGHEEGQMIFRWQQ